MKIPLLLFFVIAITACTDRSESTASADSTPKNDQFTSIIILRDDLFMVGADAADMSTSIKNLGPKDRQIDVSICGLRIRWQTIEKLTTELKASGYNRIGYVTDGDRNEKLQALCSNYAIKGTSV